MKETFSRSYLCKKDFEKDVKFVVGEANKKILKNPSTGMCKHKRPDGEYELQPTDITIILSEPGCEDQLLHRDFGRDMMGNFTQNSALSLYPLLLSIFNTRFVRVIDSTHNEEGRGTETISDKDAKLIALTPGDIFAMHPFLIHSGASNLSEDPSIALFTIVTTKDKARTMNQTFDIVDSKLDESVERDGKYYLDYSSVEGAGLGLYTRALLSDEDRVKFNGVLFKGIVPDHDDSKEFYLELSEASTSTDASREATTANLLSSKSQRT
mmetsp:Transcript_45092/g.75207  ORF Transcript_45092/g.75207 Transcript_45092/m.75207 type:complete len:268 (-) Transcript_45092:97-900(-)